MGLLYRIMRETTASCKHLQGHLGSSLLPLSQDWVLASSPTEALCHVALITTVLVIPGGQIFGLAHTRSVTRPFFMCDVEKASGTRQPWVQTVASPLAGSEDKWHNLCEPQSPYL